jgi:aminoglycoside phosphotransferase (APT) family kinase protein
VTIDAHASDTNDFIMDAVEAALPGYRTRVLTAEPMPPALNELWRLHVRHDNVLLDLVLRRYRHGVTWHADGDTQQPEREARALEHARAHGIPAPKLYGHGKDWTLVEHVAGRILVPRRQAADIDPRAVHSLAGVLARLHRLPLPDGPFPRATTPDAIRTIRARAEAAHDERLARLAARLQAMDEGPAVFVHGDANLGNVLFDDDFSVVALIDWEDSVIADYRFDVVTTHRYLMRRCPAVAPAFIDAYEEVSGAPVRDLAQWSALHSLRARAVADALRDVQPDLGVTNTDQDYAEAEELLVAAGW